MSKAIARGPEGRGLTAAEEVVPLISASAQAIVLFDDERRCVAANATACRLLGRSLSAITQMRVADLGASGTASSDDSRLDQEWRRFLDQGSERGTCSLTAADGGVVVVDFYARANFAQGLHLSMFVPVDDRRAVGAFSDGDHDQSADIKRGTLTLRERDVLALVAAGLTGIEIASRLSISPPTVESHVGNAMRKLGATNRAHATALALQAGLIAL
jgi:DNA-binding CsgD family transcriptional regulator